jgi:nitrite reductase (NO-forming)
MAIELGDLFIRPGSIEVPSNTTLTLTVTNTGQIPHDLKLEGNGTRLLNPGETEAAQFGPLNHNVQLICSVPGHAAAGMTLDVAVTGATTAPDDGEGDGTTQEAAQIEANATPGPDWQRRDPVLQPAPGGTLHQITLDAKETVIEIAPGVTQELWTFNDVSPGPVVRGKVGDVFEITLTNRGELGHSIDFHASKVAWNDEMRTLQPGESLVYRFEAKHAGVYMYHCGTAPALHHIGNGMFGAIVIDPPGLPPVDREFLLVQSEFYLGPEGEPGDLTKMQQDAWDAVVFNGYVSQYLHAPIRIEPNLRYRVWVLDAGPSENSSFHIVGTVFDTVYKEGEYLLRPGDLRGGSQTLDLQPAQGGFVEFTVDEAGLYPLVTHKFSNVGRGAIGLFQAGDVAGSTAAH